MTTTAPETTDCLFGLADELPHTGRHSGYAKIPYASDRSAYGFIPLPLAVVGGGTGPTVLLIAGSFGDEIDSQIAVARVAQGLDPAAMQGRVIVLPMANEPAARAGTRNSPIDGRNLNRSYPGDVSGTPTSVIADYIERHLMAVSDIVLDLHSDGNSLQYLPCATLIHNADPDVRARRLAAALAFGAPSVLVFHSFEERNSSGAAKRAGAIRIATEIGGPTPIASTVDGVLRVLRWSGVIEQAPAAPPVPTVRVARQDKDFIYALSDGFFEPTAMLGDDVRTGDTVGFIHDPSRPLSPPGAVKAGSRGTVVCTRGASLASRGDCLLHLAGPADAGLIVEIDAARTAPWAKAPGHQTQAPSQDRSTRRASTKRAPKRRHALRPKGRR
ncbi:MAG: succinylglutamate desuccinylase/aspartoacylase family protein [Alphaproteobacteria bacterium]|nr:succinylglutamate desuccinylase/aspartoacylase family protein [Alphaproteobacteria bacterium]